MSTEKWLAKEHDDRATGQENTTVKLVKKDRDRQKIDLSSQDRDICSQNVFCQVRKCCEAWQLLPRLWVCTGGGLCTCVCR